MDRVDALRRRLEQALSPQRLDIRDDSRLHAGHAGAAGGGGHFTVAIVAEGFRGLTSLERHRLVYQAVADLMPVEIHALAIQARTPDEST